MQKTWKEFSWKFDKLWIRETCADQKGGLLPLETALRNLWKKLIFKLNLEFVMAFL